MSETLIVTAIGAVPTILGAYWTYKIKQKPVMNGKFDKLCDSVENLKEKVEDMNEKIFRIQDEIIKNKTDILDLKNHPNG